jgi:imidazolonepropionase-like amidohydrolase
MKTRAKTLSVVSLMAIAILSLCQSGRSEEAKPDALIIKGGTIYTITHGIIHDGYILIKDGKINKIGQNLPVPQDAIILEAKDKWIMPGFVVVHSSPFAMHPIIKEDTNPKIFNYLDPFSLELRLCLATGITTYSSNAGPSPYEEPGEAGQKNYGFRNAILKPYYGSLKDMLIKEPAFLYVDMTRLLPSEKEELRGFFQRSSEFLAQEAQYEKSTNIKEAKAPVMTPDLKYYVSVLKNELPVRFNADKKKDILKVLAFVDEFSVQAQILGAAEGWLLAEEIGRRNISTIIQPEAFLKGDPYRHPSGGSNIKNAILQKEKGIEFALLSTEPSIGLGGMIGNDLLTFPLAGAFAVRGGLDEKTALEALTIEPARLLGMSDRVGSLEEGKDADIIILDGNPLDYRTYVDYTIMNGKVLYDKSKSTLYKKIPKPKKMF